jgi:hypothetical protein
MNYGLPDTMGGLRLVVSEYALSREWVFPDDPFTTYEESDRRWAIALRYGHWGPSQPAAYMIGGMMYVHPEIYAALRKEEYSK